MKTWAYESHQVSLNGLIVDVLKIFRDLQKQLQRDDLILPEIISNRDSALRKLDIICRVPYPGVEEKNLQPQGTETHFESR